MAVDFTAASNWRSRLQEVADSAALAAMGSEEGEEKTVQTAKSFVLSNGSFAAHLTVDVSIASSTPVSREVAVEIAAEIPTQFMSLVGLRTIEIKVKANARKAAPDYCIYALDPYSYGAMTVAGLGNLSMPNCGIQVNSSDPRALRHIGSGKIAATKISVVGNYEGGGYTANPKTNQPPLDDPLVSTPEPVLPSHCDYENQMLSDVEIPAGRVFCGSIIFSGKISLAPGTHYFNNAVVGFSNNCRLVGHEIIIYVSSRTSIIQAGGNGRLEITPPTSGIYSGIAIFGSRTAAPGELPIVSLAVNKNYSIKGTIYLPNHNLTLTGTVDRKLDAIFGFVVAWQVSYSGNSDLLSDGFTSKPPEGLGNSSIVLLP
ncbi:Tad domain-containing protein [Mesorhizobium sp. M0510]